MGEAGGARRRGARGRGGSESEEEAASEWFPASDAASMVVAPEEPAWEWFPTEPAASEPAASRAGRCGRGACCRGGTGSGRVARHQRRRLLQRSRLLQRRRLFRKRRPPQRSRLLRQPPTPPCRLILAICGAHRGGARVARECHRPAGQDAADGRMVRGTRDLCRRRRTAEPPAPEEPVAEEPVDSKRPALEDVPAAEEPVVEELQLRRGSRARGSGVGSRRARGSCVRGCRGRARGRAAGPRGAVLLRSRQSRSPAPEELLPRSLASRSPSGQGSSVPEETMLEEPPLEMFLVKEPTGRTAPPPVP